MTELLLKNTLWREKFNPIVLNIRRKMYTDNNNFNFEINYIRQNIMGYVTSKEWLNIGSDLEKDFFLRWSNNTIVVLQCAEYLPSALDLCLKCVTYDAKSIKNVGNGHAAEAQYAFSILLVLDRIKKKDWLR